MSFIPPLAAGEQVVATAALSNPLRSSVVATDRRLLLTSTKDLVASSTWAELEEVQLGREGAAHRLRMWTAAAPAQVLSKDDAIVGLVDHVTSSISRWNTSQGIRARLAGISLTDDALVTEEGSWPVRGAHADVITGAQLAQREGEATGFGALLKRKEDKKVFLRVTTAELVHQRELHPDRVPTAELFVVAVRAFAGTVEPEAAPAAQGLPEQLASLAQLHASGALTDDEFAAAKARLLG